MIQISHVLEGARVINRLVTREMGHPRRDKDYRRAAQGDLSGLADAEVEALCWLVRHKMMFPSAPLSLKVEALLSVVADQMVRRQPSKEVYS